MAKKKPILPPEVLEETLNNLPESHHSLQEPYRDFYSHRIEKGTPITPTALKTHIRLLLKHPVYIGVEMINKAINSGWTGIFELSEFETQKIIKAQLLSNETNPSQGDKGSGSPAYVSKIWT